MTQVRLKPWPRLFVALLAALSSALLDSHTARASDCSRTFVGLTPITELGTDFYRGVEGGLYPGGTNAPPSAHEAAGKELARSIQPLDQGGRPSPRGRYAFISIGMSNTTQEFQALKPLADADASKDPHLVIVDGAQGGVTATRWSDPNDPAWSTVDSRLAAAGATRPQVVAAWVKVADRNPTSGWPAYARRLTDRMAAVASNLKTRYPNIRVAYYSSRIYAGYATGAFNPEPYAYESGFSVKGLIEGQLGGDPGLNFDPGKGPVRAPWLSWGPYLWADGQRPRADGLTWGCSDFSSDGIHPSTPGRNKVARSLLGFMKTDSTARKWFLDAVAPRHRLRFSPTQDVDKLVVFDRLDEPGRLVANATVSVPRRDVRRVYRFNRVSLSVPAGVTTRLRLRLGETRRAAIKRALNRGQRLSARVTVRATDRAGNTRAVAARIALTP